MRNWLGNGVLLAMVLSGCGGGGGSTTVTVADFCAQKADKECQVVDSCGTADKPTCLVARKAECMMLATNAQVAPRIFRAANISACINQTNSVYATKGTITPTQIDMMNDACQYVFQGDVAESAACTVKYDCRSPFICDKGVCAKKTTKNKDELCGNPGEICNTGSFCTMMGAVYKCLAKRMLSEACDEDTNPCLENLHCFEGKCAERSAVGGACTSNGDCATTVPYCDPYIGNKCDKGLTFGGGAAACAAFGGTAGGSGGSAGTGGASGSGGAAGTDAAADGGDDGAATD